MVSESKELLLAVEDLSIEYKAGKRIVKAVNNLNFTLNKRETLGLVGETGAGKTTTALGIMGLIPSPPGVISSGRILLEGQDLVNMPAAQMRNIRGGRVSMIFQDPMTSLNPIMTVGEQIAEVIMIHEKATAREAMAKAKEMLLKVNIPAERAGEYPHQFSGGMRQRVVIAIALSCMPQLLIADEPTTALDVTIQAQVLNLMKGLKKESDASMIMITHDLGIVANICDKVAIIYAGGIVEYADKNQLFRNPLHPYTVGLFGSIPDIKADESRLKPIKGLMPDPSNLPQGCVFSPRCERAVEECKHIQPQNVEVETGHFVRCIHFKGGEAS